MKIYIHANLDAAGRDLLNCAWAGKEAIYASDLPGDEERKRAMLEAEVVMGNAPASWLEEAVSVRWIQLESTGFEYYQKLSPERQAGLRISNLKGMFAAPATETAIGGILTLYRKLDALTQLKETRQWQSWKLREGMRTLKGKSVLILGTGSIGQRAKRILLAFGCKVTLFGRRKPMADLCDLEELDAALAEHDIVLAGLPNTPATTGLLDKRRVDLMGSRCLFVNIGRGTLVDEQALVAALEESRLGGAVIDVTQSEPLPAEHPLWGCPRTVVTQHTAGGYGEELLDKAKFYVENLARYEAGDEPANIVDLKRGY